MNRIRRPFWLPAANYYVLAVAVALAFFFVVWAVLDDIDGMRAPWQTAGVSASILLIGAVVLRGVLLRHSRAAYLRQPSHQSASDRSKLTVERASLILNQIRRKSEAANVLDKIASGHREVYEMCAAFVHRIDSELPTVQAGSPRLATLLKSRTRASELHRFHTLRWAELEARTLSAEARNLGEPSERVRAARAAVAVVEEAMLSYPAEEALVASRELLSELATSIKVANKVEEAERAVLAGDVSSARALYRDALIQLGHENIYTPEREHAAEKIREAMERLSFSHDNS
ncbi:MAG: hypothetical protein JO314_11800 [Acidobacteria bacterium]|nr:hypothetical protein [Acidobacteriota bacterium]